MKLIVIRGKIVAGLGQGQFFSNQDGYKLQFAQKLGFQPYPGTLNLKLEEPFVQPRRKAIEIHGFKEDSRTYGGCRCYPCWIKGIDCAIIRPDRSRHSPNIIEIMAPVNLRISLNLQDGDEVELICKTDPISGLPTFLE